MAELPAENWVLKESLITRKSHSKIKDGIEVEETMPSSDQRAHSETNTTTSSVNLTDESTSSTGSGSQVDRDSITINNVTTNGE